MSDQNRQKEPLAIDVSGLHFKNNFMVASGPTVKWLEQIELAEKHGWASISLKLAFDPEPYISLPPRYRYFKKQGYHAFTAESRLTFEQCLKLLEQGRKNTSDLVLLANITYVGEKEGLEGWTDMAKSARDAGAHAIELNMCCPNMSFNVSLTEKNRTEQTGASLGQNPEVVSAIAEAVAGSVDIPVFVKLTPEGGRVSDVAKACFDKGIPCVGTTANRLAIADFDVENMPRGPYRLQDQPTLACFSGPWVKPLALRDVYEMRRKAGPEAIVLGTGGVSSHSDAIQMMMCGADFIGICTETMLRGFAFLPRWIEKITDFMDRHGYSSYRDFRDAAARAITSADKLTLHGGYAEVDIEKCTGCGLCEKIGHCNAITIKDKKSLVDRDACLACSTCVDVCPTGAIEMVETGILENKNGKTDKGK